MAETRSIVLTDETREILLSRLVKMKETYDEGFAQINELLHAFRLSLRSRDKKEENPEDQALNDEDLVETEPIETEDRAVKNEAIATMISAFDKEEPISQLQVPVSKLEPSLRFHNTSPDVCEDFKSLVGVDGLFDHVKARAVLLNKSAGVTDNQIAHKVFGKMSQPNERLGIKKKRKGFKSWMFKYKRGDKKLHTLTFSNDMRMVVSPQLRKAVTSGDLLMFNGKYSLPRRTIGSKLETGEIVLSNQERNELCTEKKDEVKGCLERLPASVLMEEEPDSMRVNEVKLENKMTWTKLKVKKHDNLSWKEDESRSIGCILKLGGVAITCKNVLEKIYDEKLEIMACQLRPAMMESSVPSKVIGKDGSKRHGRPEFSCDVDYLGDHESSSFRESAVASTDLSTVTKIIDSGFVPVLHRDAVLDNILGCTILSGDVIICHFVDHLKPECVVFFAKEASGKLEQFSGLCKELMDSDVSLDMNYETQHTKFMKKSTACCCKQVYASFYVWLMQDRFVIQQVMRDKKIRLSKRWWFKYKCVKEGIQRLQILLRYKRRLELEEWFKIWSRGETWRKQKEIDQFTIETEEEMEDMMEEALKQQQGNSEPLVTVPDVDAKVELVWKSNSLIFHFETRVWDPGRSLIKDATPREFPFHSTVTISFSLLFFLSKNHLQIFFSTNLEDKVSSKEGDLI